MASHLITRDDILRVGRTHEAHYVDSNTGARYLVLRHDGHFGVYGVSERTGQLVHITWLNWTDSATLDTPVSVGISFAVDTGDAAGTLLFGEPEVLGSTVAGTFIRTYDRLFV